MLDGKHYRHHVISKRVTVSFMRKAYNETQINIYTVFGIRNEAAIEEIKSFIENVQQRSLIEESNHRI